MKVALIQPNLDEKHEHQNQAYGSAMRPPETGLAVLSSWITNNSTQQHEVKVLYPNKKVKELSEEASKCDVLGMTDWFSNHDSVIELAKETKNKNRDLIVVLGGPNASMMPKLILKNHPHIDYVVSRDGEDALLGIVEGKETKAIPNLWYRDQDNIRFTYQQFTNLKNMPLWDFSNFQNVNERLKEYLEAQNTGLDPWLVPPVALFSFRGCMKAIREGVCSYCTSSEEQGRALPSDKLWEQVKHLNRTYGAEIFYMVDDIFPVTVKRVEKIAKARPDDARSRIRAYGDLTDMAKLSQGQLEGMARNLEKIGVFNLFFGSEHYDPDVLARMNKEGISSEESARVIKTIYEIGGIKTTIACLLGLPAESQDSLKTNLRVLEDLMGINGCIERLYISIGMPLAGTQWFRDLENNPDITTEYQRESRKVLKLDDSPDYPLLSRLSIKHTTSTSPKEVNDYLSRMINVAKEKMPEYRIGGFMLNISE